MGGGVLGEREAHLVQVPEDVLATRQPRKACDTRARCGIFNAVHLTSNIGIKHRDAT